jgi:hypothetical protein
MSTTTHERRAGGGRRETDGLPLLPPLNAGLPHDPEFNRLLMRVRAQQGAGYQMQRRVSPDELLRVNLAARNSMNPERSNRPLFYRVLLERETHHCGAGAECAWWEHGAAQVKGQRTAHAHGGTEAGATWATGATDCEGGQRRTWPRITRAGAFRLLLTALRALRVFPLLSVTHQLKLKSLTRPSAGTRSTSSGYKSTGAKSRTTVTSA